MGARASEGRLLSLTPGEYMLKACVHELGGMSKMEIEGTESCRVMSN